MFQGSLFGSTIRAGLHRQASRVYGSGSGRPLHASPQIWRNHLAFSGLVNSSRTETQVDSSICGNLSLKLGLDRVAENVSLPCGLSFKSFIHSGEPREAEEGRTPRPMDLQWLHQETENGVNERPPLYGERARTPRSMDYVQGLHQKTGNGVNEQPPLHGERGRTLGSIDFVQGLHQETGNGVNERPPLFGERGRTLRSMDYVQGLLNEERGYGVNGQTRLYQPRGEVGKAPTPMDNVQGLLHERGTDFGGRAPLYQPQVESNADIVHIKLTRNNSYVTLTDSKGNRKIGVSAVIAAGKGDKPGRYSAEAAAEYIGRRVRQMKIRSVVVKVSGLTFFRRKKDAILAFKDGYTNSRGDMNPIVHIEDTTRTPHNGCRLPKKRRI